MGFSDRLLTGYKRTSSAASDFIRSDNKKERMREVGYSVIQPKFIPERFFQVSKASQWLAACLLPFVIVPSFVIIVAINGVIVDVFLNNGTSLGSQSPVLTFVVNMVGIMFFIVAAWSWFMWVRTGGFRIFEM